MIFVITEIVCIPTGTSSALKKKSQYIASLSRLGSDPPIGSDWESGRDNRGLAWSRPLQEALLILCSRRS